MSALTVRANMRMMFDDGSANKAQSKYMASLAKMEREATRQTTSTNRQLVAQHRALVSGLEAQNRAADTKLLADKDEIAKKVARSAGRAQRAIKPPSHKKKGLDADTAARYKKEGQLYSAALKKMEAAQEKFVLRAKALGAQGLNNKARITAQQFMHQEAAIRKKIIGLAEQEVRAQRKGTYERKLAQKELDKYKTAHMMASAAENQHHQFTKKNLAEIRASQAMTTRQIKFHNGLLKERMAMLQRINMAIASTSAQLMGGFQNALMFSGIALMTFGFRLQSVISDFMAFEKELMNAQSIYQQSFDILFDLSDEIVNFGTQYGITLQSASEGLYTLASAGLSASESQEVLANTLKLSMAVQGDHETIAKLTTQTIFGFGLEMSDSAILTDKFAHAINKSLIEYQDLASAVKFAMPFFVATGQNIDQLLGSLEILTNRALEAGIAGRGLRQALAEFAQHADDNTAAFRKMGVEIMDANGEFKMLSEIAKEFQTAMGPAAGNVELMTTLLEDLNVRGATAFVHLVTEADEFQGAVDDLANSAGAATEMANIQQQSLSNQIQVIKNALMAPFLLSDKVGRSNKTMNTFGNRLHEITGDFEQLFIKRMPDGTAALTDMGAALRDTVLVLLEDLADMLKGLINMFTDMNGEVNGLSQLLHALMLPLKLTITAIDLLGEGLLQGIIMFKAINALLPVTQALTMALVNSNYQMAQSEALKAQAHLVSSRAMWFQGEQMRKNSVLQRNMLVTQSLANLAMLSGLILINKTNDAYKMLGYGLLFLAGAYTAASIARILFGETTKKGKAGIAVAAIAGGAAMAVTASAMQAAVNPPELNIPVSDLGMRMYDMGGIAGRHFPVLVEPGETIVPKTQNMLGGSGGITLNIEGDIVTNDADDFAERIAEVLPEALRMTNDIGGI